MPGTRKLGRTTDHRISMLRGMVTYLFENGRIETTVTRAKEVRAMAEKMITIAKDNSLHSKRKVMAYITKEDVAKKLFDEIAPKYKDVNGGYTRIIKTGPRRGDKKLIFNAAEVFPCGAVFLQISCKKKINMIEFNRRRVIHGTQRKEQHMKKHRKTVLAAIMLILVVASAVFAARVHTVSLDAENVAKITAKSTVTQAPPDEIEARQHDAL